MAGRRAASKMMRERERIGPPHATRERQREIERERERTRSARLSLDTSVLLYYLDYTSDQRRL